MKQILQTCDQARLKPTASDSCGLYGFGAVGLKGGFAVLATTSVFIGIRA